MTEITPEIRKDFPLLTNTDVAYLDSSATSQKPREVIEAVRRFYEEDNANPLRGLYDLSMRATEAYERARACVAGFIHADGPDEIIFTRNATESANLVAMSYGEAFIHEGDEIVVSVMEHHSNMLPWQVLAKRKGAVLRYLFCGPDGSFTDEQIANVITERTKLLAVTHISNVLGRLNPVEKLIAKAHAAGAAAVIDGAQSVPHIPVDVKALDADFLIFSGHKMLGPMGIGVLYGKRALLDKMPPFLTGGEMIESVTLNGFTTAELPHKFEAGTVNAAGAVGLEAAIRYIERLGFEAIEARENALTRLAFYGLRAIPHVKILGSEDPDDHHGILSFVIEGVHPHDVSAILNADGVAVRAGHHCAQPLIRHLGFRSTTRASLMFYNTEEEVARFLASVRSARKKMGWPED